MNKFKKIIIIVSISLNIIFFTLSLSLLYKYTYYKGKEHVFRQLNKGYQEYKNKKFSSRNDFDRSYHDNDDDDDDDDDDRHDQKKKFVRKFAKEVFTKPELRHNFQRIYQIHQEIIELSRNEVYEDQIRKRFDEFEIIFISNKNIIEEELFSHMKNMEPWERAALIQNFLRLGSSHQIRPP